MNLNQIEKIVYYRQNPIQWIKDNIKITHTARGIIPFNVYPFQEKAINLMLSKKFLICLKSRQVGMSTTMQAYSLWCALYYPNFKILILSTGMKAATRFLGDLKGMYDRLPEEMKMEITSEIIFDGKKGKKRTNNKTEIEFANGSVITALPANSSAARGASINLLIIDEAAFIRNIDETYAAIFPTLSRAFKSSTLKPFGLCILSTPFGIESVGRWYYTTYMNAVEKRNKFIPLRIHWTEVDEYDEEWYLEQCAALNWDYRRIASELELSFIGSGDTYIPNKILNIISTREPFYKTLRSDLWIFKQPEQNRKYVIGVDYAYGKGKDSSAIQVIDAITLEQVAEFLSNKINTSDFADVVTQVAGMYNNALTNIENNAGGNILIERILEKYPQMNSCLYRDSKAGNVVPDTPKYGKLLPSKNSDIGTTVTGSSRDVILSNMYTIILENYIDKMDNFEGLEETIESVKKKFMEARKTGRTGEDVHKVRGIINSERLLFQLLGFVIDKGGKPQGKSDDAVMAFAHALYAWTKSKKYLLSNAADIFSSYVQLTPRLELEKKYNEQMIRILNPGIQEKDIDYFMTAMEDIEEEDGETEDTRTAEIWGAFLG